MEHKVFNRINNLNFIIIEEFQKFKSIFNKNTYKLKNNQTYNEKYIWSINRNYEDYCDKIMYVMGYINNFEMNVNILRKNNLGYNSFY